ncbi:MAG TPA: response regulator [Xanthobacteraceae bacterium]|jgi:FixJ family two-component response regulator
MIGPKTVAVVDDEAAMRKAVVRLLSANGFATRDYASAEEFLNCPAARESACLVVDINLGGISGIELRRQLKASGSKLPVIFITGIDRTATQREAMEAGCVGYLPKPFAGNVLIAMIAKATE